MKFFAAPLQGYTNAVFRRLHMELFGGVDCYFTPFLRVEKGEPCRRTLRDIVQKSGGEGVSVVPQIIFRDAVEFGLLRDVLRDAGFHRIDLNMGCPFPPQMSKGRGTGFLSRTEELRKVADMVRRDKEIKYSVKMRLGADRADQWHDVVDLLNTMPLTHVAVHPRTGREQYKGSLHFDEFDGLASALVHPLVFNGEIRACADIDAVCGRYPGLYGVMAGRGLLSRPSLFAEYAAGCVWPLEKLREMHLRLHGAVLEHYRASLSGEHQVLAHIKSFWDYPPEFLDRKSLKAISKSRSMADYLAVVRSL
ncbi:MAG: tRNA-dihydrouridine synthase family protein [Muribaculaceae bacterium]|nr:tRNA-dihydrouridine synthase family protein [Muribaculaceae bacterium]